VGPMTQGWIRTVVLDRHVVARRGFKVGDSVHILQLREGAGLDFIEPKACVGFIDEGAFSEDCRSP
jgi:hypothetical protein